MSKCQFCGKELIANAIFCTGCGKTVAPTAPVAPAPSVAPAPAVPVAPASSSKAAAPVASAKPASPASPSAPIMKAPSASDSKEAVDNGDESKRSKKEKKEIYEEDRRFINEDEVLAHGEVTNPALLVFAIIFFVISAVALISMFGIRNYYRLACLLAFVIFIALGFIFLYQYLHWKIHLYVFDGHINITAPNGEFTMIPMSKILTVYKSGDRFLKIQTENRLVFGNEFSKNKDRNHCFAVIYDRMLAWQRRMTNNN